MPIIVSITPSGVKEVRFESIADFFEDMDLAVWPLVRAELHRLDAKLKRTSKAAVAKFDRTGAETKTGG